MENTKLSEYAKEVIRGLMDGDGELMHNDNVNAMKAIINALATGKTPAQDTADIIKAAAQIVHYDNLIEVIQGKEGAFFI